MSLEDWQRALRRQFVADKDFEIVKLDGHPVFCECLDFKTNQLGTCSTSRR